VSYLSFSNKSYIVFGCRRVPCRTIFDIKNPIAGKKTKMPAQGFNVISMIGTELKLIM